MSARDIEQLREQLREVLREERAEALEIAAIAGLLGRLSPGDALLGPARARAEGIASERLQAAAEAAADGVLEVDEDDEPGESWDRLSALDELSAAATWLDRQGEIEESIGAAARSIRAFPECWRAHSRTASALLRRQPPSAEDPARALWGAVEASRWELAGGPSGGAPIAAVIALGLPAVIPLASSRQQLLAAADALPEEAPWRALASGEGWDLALTRSERGEAILLLDGEVDARFERDGQEVAPRRLPEGRVCDATPGQWRVQLGDRELAFELQP